MSHALAGAGLVILLSFAKQSQLRMAAVDELRVRHELPELFVAPLRERILDGDFSQRFGMRIEHLHALVALADDPGLGFSQAMNVTKTLGAPTVAVVTAPEEPSSSRFWMQLNDSAWARANRGLVQLVRVEDLLAMRKWHGARDSFLVCNLSFKLP